MTPVPVIVHDRVRWSDVDKMNVMYFGAYLRFVEHAETEFFRAAGFTYDQLSEDLGVWLARVHLEVDYRSPARLDEEIAVRAELEKIGGSTLHFRFPVERAGDGTALASVRLVLACLNRQTMKSTRVPAPLAAAMRERLPSPPAG